MAQAGSAENFLKVDLTYVEEAAKAANEAKIPHFSLVSSQGSLSLLSLFSLSFFSLPSFLLSLVLTLLKERIKICGQTHSLPFTVYSISKPKERQRKQFPNLAYPVSQSFDQVFLIGAKVIAFLRHLLCA